MRSHCYCSHEERVLYCILHKIATYIQRLQDKQRRSSCFTLRKASCLCVQCTQILFGSSGLTHWKIRSVIREVECASLCNNSSPDDRSCLKFRLEDAKVHQVILHRSKICVSNRKRVLNKPRISCCNWCMMMNISFMILLRNAPQGQDKDCCFVTDVYNFKKHL